MQGQLPACHASKGVAHGSLGCLFSCLQSCNQFDLTSDEVIRRDVPSPYS